MSGSEPKKPAIERSSGAAAPHWQKINPVDRLFIELAKWLEENAEETGVASRHPKGIRLALGLANKAGIREGAEVLIVSPTTDLWFERVAVAKGAKVEAIDLSDFSVDNVDCDFTRALRKWDAEAARKLAKLIGEREVRCEKKDFLKYEAAGPKDVVCLFAVTDDPDTEYPETIVGKAMLMLKDGGRLVVSYLTPHGDEHGGLIETADSLGLNANRIAHKLKNSAELVDPQADVYKIVRKKTR